MCARRSLFPHMTVVVRPVTCDLTRTRDLCPAAGAVSHSDGAVRRESGSAHHSRYRGPHRWPAVRAGRGIRSVFSACQGLRDTRVLYRAVFSTCRDSGTWCCIGSVFSTCRGLRDRVLYRLSTQHMSGTPGQGTVWSQYSAHVGDSRDRVLYRLSTLSRSPRHVLNTEPIQHPVP